LSREDLLEIDLYALSILQELIQRVNKAYETFAFHEVYHSIYQFCVIDMSAFYLDILKDRLYTFRADSRERRASQIVLYNILISLTKLIAPILSFTAEEIWQHIPGNKDESVFLSAFPEADIKWIDRELVEKWKKLSRIRDEVNRALEIKRQEKLIGNALESKVTIYANNETSKLLNNYKAFLPTLFIVSSSEVLSDTVIPPDAYRSSELEGLSIVVTKADGKKCQRCWNWDLSVGTYASNPDLCEKCYKAIK
jgi:isoleucyl-tRNA synthetase